MCIPNEMEPIGTGPPTSPVIGVSPDILRALSYTSHELLPLVVKPSLLKVGFTRPELRRRSVSPRPQFNIAEPHVAVRSCWEYRLLPVEVH